MGGIWTSEQWRVGFPTCRNTRESRAKSSNMASNDDMRARHQSVPQSTWPALRFPTRTKRWEPLKWVFCSVKREASFRKFPKFINYLTNNSPISWKFLPPKISSSNNYHNFKNHWRYFLCLASFKTMSSVIGGVLSIEISSNIVLDLQA